MQSEITFSTPTYGVGSGARLKILHTRLSLEGKTAILDVSNISRDNSYGKKGSYQKVLEVERKLKGINPDILIIRIADASLRYYLVDGDLYDFLKKNNEVLEVSKGTNADLCILLAARANPDAVIISNDHFREFNGPFKKVKNRRIGFKFRNGETFFYSHDGRFLA